MRRMEFREALNELVISCDNTLYMVSRMAENMSFNNFAIKVSILNVRLLLYELHEAIN